MRITLATPHVDDLPAALRALAAWQVESGAMQLHPGDLGWFWRFGPDATAAAVRTWSQGVASSRSACWTARPCCG